MDTAYLSSARKQFAYYKLLGERTFAQLSDEELRWQHNADTNSVATIVKHLWGNMRSRWTDFLTSDGEKPLCRVSSHSPRGEESTTMPAPTG